MFITVQNARNTMTSYWAAIADYAQIAVRGAIVVLHPFGRNLGFNPHIHLLITEGGFDRSGKFIHNK